MKKVLLYVELKDGHSGPAWIGYGQLSKSGVTVYFDGKILKRKKGIIGNHVDLESGEEYWVSGVKKNGTDRHWAGSGKVHIEKLAIKEYLNWIGKASLPKNKFIEVELNNFPNKELSRKLENEQLE